MTNFAKIALIAAALTASAAQATQGTKVTALGYGDSRQHAKMVTIQTWTQAAFAEYGFANWNNAYIGHMECHENINAGASTTQQYGALSREIMRTGGNPNAAWSCIVSGFQDT